MKRLFFLFFCVMLSLSGSVKAAESEGPSQITWLTNYASALKQSKHSGKPILLFFTGSDWCSWCTKLEQEVLHTPEFSQEVADKFIFVKLDFPKRSQQEMQIAEQNASLKGKYHVPSFPTILIIDSEERQIGQTGYRPGGGKSYASHLLEIISGYSAYLHKMRHLNEEHLTSSCLMKLYQQANDFEFSEDAKKIITVGTRSKNSHFFFSKVTDGLLKKAS